MPKNISVVDIDKLKNKKIAPKKQGKAVDLNVLTSSLDMMKAQIEIMEEMADAIENAANNRVKDAGLSNVKFEVTNFKDFIDSDGFGALIFNGSDGVYNYNMRVFPFADEETEAPVIATFLFRSDANDEDKCDVFVFDKKEWRQTTMIECTGKTLKQQQLWRKAPESVKNRVLDAYIDSYGAINDQKFDSLIEKNEELIELAKLLGDLVMFDFAHRTYATLMSCFVDGLCVQFYKGKYVLKQSCSLLENPAMGAVFSTNDVEEMAEVVKNVVDHCYSEDVMAAVPLSKHSYMIVTREVDGLKTEYRFLDGRKEVSDVEKRMADAYVEKTTDAIAEMDCLMDEFLDEFGDEFDDDDE